MKKLKVVVVGETCVDKFIYCKINRLSPEAPVPVLIPTHTEVNQGMSGNTCANIKALSPDSQVIHFSNLKQITKTRYDEKIIVNTKCSYLIRVRFNSCCR